MPEVSVFTPKRVESRRDGRVGATLEEPRDGAVAVRWEDGENEDALTEDLRFLPVPSERRPVAHPDYTLGAAKLAELLAADLAELPAEILANYIAPKARQAMRDLDSVFPKPTEEVKARREQAERFWRRLDAYCEAEVRERDEWTIEKAPEAGAMSTTDGLGR